MKITKTVYWIVVDGKRYCSVDSISDANFMVDYLRSIQKDKTQEIKIEPDAKWEDENNG